MLFSVAQLPADADNEYGTVFPADGILSLFRGEVGITLAKFLGMYEMYVLRQECFHLWICLANKELRG